MKSNSGMNRSVMCIALLCLIVGASAAVFITYSPEAILSFYKEKPGPDVSDIVTLIPDKSESFLTPRVDFGELENDTLDWRVIHINKGVADRTANVTIDVRCSEGLVVQGDGNILDLNQFVYTGIDGVGVNLLNTDRYTVMDTEHIRFVANDGGYVFLTNEEANANIYVELVSMAYGNYSIEISVN